MLYADKAVSNSADSNSQVKKLMRLQNFGLVTVLVLSCFGLVSCTEEVKKPTLVDTQTENVFSANDREELYNRIENAYGEVVDARAKFLKNEMYASTLSSIQSRFLVLLSRLEKEGLTPEMIERLKEIQVGEAKAYDAFKKAKSSCNSNPELAKICSFEMAFYAKRSGQLIAKYEANTTVVPNLKK